MSEWRNEDMVLGAIGEIIKKEPDSEGLKSALSAIVSDLGDEMRAEVGTFKANIVVECEEALKTRSTQGDSAGKITTDASYAIYASADIEKTGLSGAIDAAAAKADKSVERLSFADNFTKLAVIRELFNWAGEQKSEAHCFGSIACQDTIKGKPVAARVVTLAEYMQKAGSIGLGD